MDSIKELEHQLADNPFDLSARADLARALQKAGQTERARKEWTLLVSQDPSPTNYLGLALATHALDLVAETKRAIQAAQKATYYAAAIATLGPDERAQLEAIIAPWAEKAASPAAEEGVAPVRPTPALHVITGGASAAVPDAKVLSIHRSQTVRFSDVAGMDELKKTLRVRIIDPFLHPSIFERFKKKSGGGVLLYGPPGCGKTLIARAIATECSASFTAIGISDVLNMWLGQSEKNLAEVFHKARSEKPAVLFFDELDALAYSRSKASSDHTRTVVNEFLNQLDGAGARNDGLLILGATNMPWDVDEAMKRPGRFDRQVFVPPPDASAREAMLRMKLLDVPCSRVNYVALASSLEGFSGADIDGVIENAKETALLRELDTKKPSEITESDLLGAAREATPTTLDWLKTARNLVKFGGAGQAYKDVEAYLRKTNQY